MKITLQFELYLLSRMRATELVAAAVRELGVSETVMTEAANEVVLAGFETPGHSASLYLEWLDQPVCVEDCADFSGEIACARKLRFDLFSWPGLQFRVLEHPDGWVFGTGFVRAASAPRRWADGPQIAAWQYVRSEVESRFGPGRLVDGWNSSTDLDFELPDFSTGRPSPCRMLFDFDLLQAVVVQPSKTMSTIDPHGMPWGEPNCSKT